jgi:hypothetical protein
MTATKTLRRRSRARIDIRAAVRSWLIKDDAIKNLSTGKEQDRVLILEHLDEHGQEDENGHKWVWFTDDPVEGRVKGIKREKRVTKTINQERAAEYLKRRKLWSRCVETIEVLDEAAVLALNFAPAGQKPTISDEDLADLYDVTETYAFVPQRVKL